MSVRLKPLALAQGLITAALLTAILCGSNPPMAQEAGAIDPYSGLLMAPGWQTVRAHCTVCHSAQLITLQQGDRASWLSMIRWMQKTQGLWPFDEQTEKTILDYLAGSYPPARPSRRQNLPVYARPSYRAPALAAPKLSHEWF